MELTNAVFFIFPRNGISKIFWHVMLIAQPIYHWHPTKVQLFVWKRLLLMMKLSDILMKTSLLVVKMSAAKSSPNNTYTTRVIVL